MLFQGVHLYPTPSSGVTLTFNNNNNNITTTCMRLYELQGYGKSATVEVKAERMTRGILETPLNSPVLSLTLIFLAWRTTLFAVALLSPGPGYDTSTSLLFDAMENFHGLGAQTTSESWAASLAERLARKLVRWDAIYFATVSHRGYLYEQEYAFGMGLTSVVSFLTSRTHFSPYLSIHRLHLISPQSFPPLTIH